MSNIGKNKPENRHKYFSGLVTMEDIYIIALRVYCDVMACPACGSNKLRFREATGLEYLILLFISKRKYRCRECGLSFRMPDRRRVPRNKPEAGKAGRASI